MSFQSHINNSCRAVSYHMYNSKRIRKYLSVDTTRTLIDAFIMGRVDYCDSDGGPGALAPHFSRGNFFLVLV